MVMRHSVPVFVLAVGLAGCNAVLGIDDHPLAPAVTSDEAGTGPAESGVPEAAAPHADLPEAGSDSAAGCTAGDLRCSGNTPQKCVGGSWQDQPACGGATPVCSNGVCGSFRATGGIRSTAPVAASAADGGARLVSGGFELGTRTCNAQGTCVTGGIVP
jgi:hypothetical protein